jgi:hypothetical protein
MRSKMLLTLIATLQVFVFWMIIETAGSANQAAQPLLREGDGECPVSVPNGIAAGEDHKDKHSYGNARLSVGPFGLWPNGTVTSKPGGHGFVESGGALGMEFGWQRSGVSGKLTIEGRRLDADAPPLRSEVSEIYLDHGFQSTYLIFPTPGCWEVTGRVADAELTFITRVVKIGNGPTWRRVP